MRSRILSTPQAQLICVVFPLNSKVKLNAVQMAQFEQNFQKIPTDKLYVKEYILLDLHTHQMDRNDSLTKQPEYVIDFKIKEPDTGNVYLIRHFCIDDPRMEAILAGKSKEEVFKAFNEKVDAVIAASPAPITNPQDSHNAMHHVISGSTTEAPTEDTTPPPDEAVSDEPGWGVLLGSAIAASGAIAILKKLKQKKATARVEADEVRVEKEEECKITV